MRRRLFISHRRARLKLLRIRIIRKSGVGLGRAVRCGRLVLLLLEGCEGSCGLALHGIYFVFDWDWNGLDWAGQGVCWSLHSQIILRGRSSAPFDRGRSSGQREVGCYRHCWRFRSWSGFNRANACLHRDIFNQQMANDCITILASDASGEIHIVMAHKPTEM
jgi:hypothetical protein